MRPIVQDTKSFVVRVWQEPREIEGEPPVWRGWVEHVQSGDRVYFRDLEESANFISSHLDGHALSPLRLRRWRDKLWKWVSRLGWLAAL